MSSRSKRKLDAFDPNASDPDDLDFDIREARGTPQRRNRQRNRSKTSSKPKSNKRQRRDDYGGSDVDDDEEIVSDDSFTDRSASEEFEINPNTGRSVRRAAKKPVKYEESEEEAIQDTPSEDEEEPPLQNRGRRGRQERAESSKPSLIVKLKMPADSLPRNNTRTRQASKGIMRGKTPEVVGTRRSSRLSHDVESPILAISNSGKHVDILRPGTRSPEPFIARATRGGKGLMTQQHSAIMEASQEASMVRNEDSPGPLDDLLGGNDTQVYATDEASAEPEVQVSKEEEADDDAMDGVIQESQQEGGAEETDDEGPVTRGGRNLRSRGKSAKRKRGADESSDFEPVADEDKEDEEMSEAENDNNHRSTSEESGSGSGRRSARLRARRSQRGRRQSDSSEHESFLDADELAEEAQELNTNKRRRLSRRNPDNDLTYDTAPKLRNRARNTVDYRLIRPEQNQLFDDDDTAPVVDKSRSRGGRSTYRSLFSHQGPFGGGVEGGAEAVGGIDSDSSDDEVQKAPKAIGGAFGMTPTTGTAPGFGFPQTHHTDALQATGGGPANLGKIKDRKLLADADPLGVDVNVNYDSVGGLDDHIGKLKEMVMLPLLYPEAFKPFKITPPRGVLFHGPPGTGKTLLARALASTVSNNGQKVTFYMRKGADALSKWVGEAEKQLRLLFEEARKNQPSIIFFDEIDGLAPVRSSKQEQIHASIVATLLALMDGMDGRGQVIVIGATNRPDSVDPALRRPGRFDREFYFPLPNLAGRRAIIDIHTRNWEPPLKPEFKDQLAEMTKGYGGADLRALCTEAALNAIQGTYPQIYRTERKLLIDPANIKVLAKDFMISIDRMVPSSQRTISSTASPLAKHIEPLLRKPLQDVMKLIDEFIPRRKKLTALEEAEYDDRDDDKGFEREATLRMFERSRVFRPRLLISGLEGMGQQYLGAALLSKIEGLHVQSFDLPTILEDPARTPEAAITQLFTEVRRHKPSVIYIPYVDVWYQTLPPAAIKTFRLLLRTIGANEPIMLLGITELLNEKDKPDPQMMADLFSFTKNNVYHLQRPDQPARNEFFNNISHYIRMSPADFPDPDNRKKRELPELEPAPVVAPVVDPAEVAARERQQRKQDRLTLNKLKVMIQPIMDQLKKSYRRFAKPIIDEADFAYLLTDEDPNTFTSDLPPEQQQEQGVFRPFERAKDNKGVDVLLHVPSGNRYYNLDITVIEKRLSNGYYKRPKDFLFDVKTLAKDARTLGDPERTLKGNEMVANVEVDIEMICQTNPALVAECDAVYVREQERERKAKEKMEKAKAEGQAAADAAKQKPQQSNTTGDASGPIILGEPIPPGQIGIPPVTPSRPVPSLSNGTDPGGFGALHHNGSALPSAHDEDSHMADSQDLNANSHHEFQTPSRVGTQTQPFSQTQKSQVSGRTFMAPNSHPGDYHNSASTTTSGQKTSDRSSGARFNTQSTNGVAPPGVPDLAEMMSRPGGSQLPDTQEQHYVSSQLSNSQPSQPSQQPNSMPAPAPPRHAANIASLLNNAEEKPKVILNETRLQEFQDMLVRSTSGCSVEQLEQINAALMDTIWAQRKLYNRDVVMHAVSTTFNAVIEDISSIQHIMKPSQETQVLPHPYGLDSQQPTTDTQMPDTQYWSQRQGEHA
ncbi:AAA-domain-containing protein [Westerdykella ornata]|uniref:AAA-domain-containing protein n=1 Tax=Westerdykella ornata TaxID=318751 RepID=A0A6A6JHW8_WESOR|nr:AAA-domain-containing protein [Westerdykella ornata]KAF2275987.1 AAA-domain-containing protein [Westerdykella ornata]